jgi:hypothetical protein
MKQARKAAPRARLFRFGHGPWLAYMLAMHEQLSALLMHGAELAGAVTPHAAQALKYRPMLATRLGDYSLTRRLRGRPCRLRVRSDLPKPWNLRQNTRFLALVSDAVRLPRPGFAGETVLDHALIAI